MKADLARTLPLMSWSDGRSDGKKLMKSLSLIAASARGAAEQFYLPADVAEAFHTPWTPADTWLVLDPSLKAHLAARPPAAKVIGRNEPCQCGSGRKWKKCCGAASAAV